MLEANLIKKYKPFFNIKLADDKFYPYIKISKETIPYIVVTRKKDDKNADYFGPYTQTASVKIVLKLLRRIFPYQSVKNHPKRKCLYYHLSLCPCVNVNIDKLQEYKKNIKKIKEFLLGKKDKVIKGLEKEKKLFIKNEEFEKAAKIQDKIKRINLITSGQFNPFEYIKDPDLYNTRIKKEVKSLKEIIGKYYGGNNNLERIECFDISNIHGKNATGSMVVFTSGEADKKYYRRFKIKSENSPDDFRMMREVISRRVKHKEWTNPNLMVIDGGKGQVRSAFEVLYKNKLNIPLIGLAKSEEIIVFIDYSSRQFNFQEVKLPIDTPGVNLLRRVRDEAHRFAITYHKLLRKKMFIPKIL